MVKLNTGLKLAELFHRTQTEIKKSALIIITRLERQSVQGRSALLDMAQWQNYIRST
jgi:hypothetical protein